MSSRIKANGEKWDVRLSREEPHAGVTSVIFRCATNSSFGWRVVEVPAGQYESPEQIDELPEAELRALFDRSQPFDYAHDPHARQDVIADAHGR